MNMTTKRCQSYIEWRPTYMHCIFRGTPSKRNKQITHAHGHHTILISVLPS